MNIGIFGGTFNPIHNGHLLVAEYIREHLNLEKIIFIPSGDSPLKPNIKVKKENRFEMVERSIRSNEYFSISDIEMKREGKSYTINTIKEIKNKYPNDNFYFLIGQDAIIDLDKWYKFEELISIITFVIVTRDEDKKKISNKFLPYNPKFIFVNSPNIEISSTEIRNRVKNGKSIRYMVSDNILEYIYNKGLYKPDME